jgi:undecaprenyl-diphosphatase
MNIPQAVFLGVLQGITEFLPVSSSGHLVLAQHFLGLRQSQLFFDVAVHAGTLVALIPVFRRDLSGMIRDCLALPRRPRSSPPSHPPSEHRQGAKMAWMIVIGSVPTAVIGVLWRDVFERFFSSPGVAGVGLGITGLILMWSRWSREHRSHLEVPGVLDALLVGLAQGAALTPGLSRSGLTIAAALLLGLRRDLAFRFSFLLSIPAILGALGLQIVDVSGQWPGWPPVVAGFLSAFLIGWASLRLLRLLVDRGKLFSFAPYCFVVGAIALVVAF